MLTMWGLPLGGLIHGESVSRCAEASALTPSCWVRCGGYVEQTIHGESVFLTGRRRRRTLPGQRAIAGAVLPRDRGSQPDLGTAEAFPWAIHGESHSRIDPTALVVWQRSTGSESGRAPPYLIHGESDSPHTMEMIHGESCGRFGSASHGDRRRSTGGQSARPPSYPIHGESETAGHPRLIHSESGGQETLISARPPNPPCRQQVSLIHRESGRGRQEEAPADSSVGDSR